MVRAIKHRTSTETKEWLCSDCNEWGHYARDWTEYTAYQHSTSDELLESGGEIYYDTECSETRLYQHDNCGTYFTEKPDQREFSEVWVCGECRDEYDDQEDARHCCE